MQDCRGERIAVDAHGEGKHAPKNIGDNHDGCLRVPGTRPRDVDGIGSCTEKIVSSVEGELLLSLLARVDGVIKNVLVKVGWDELL